MWILIVVCNPTDHQITLYIFNCILIGLCWRTVDSVMSQDVTCVNKSGLNEVNWVAVWFQWHHCTNQLLFSPWESDSCDACVCSCARRWDLAAQPCGPASWYQIMTWQNQSGACCSWCSLRRINSPPLTKQHSHPASSAAQRSALSANKDLKRFTHVSTETKL